MKPQLAQFFVDVARELVALVDNGHCRSSNASDWAEQALDLLRNSPERVWKFRNGLNGSPFEFHAYGTREEAREIAHSYAADADCTVEVLAFDGSHTDTITALCWTAHTALPDSGQSDPLA